MTDEKVEQVVRYPERNSKNVQKWKKYLGENAYDSSLLVFDICGIWMLAGGADQAPLLFFANRTFSWEKVLRARPR